MLTILTFTVSNVIIYAYRRIFQEKVALKAVSLAVVVVGLVAVFYFGSKENSLGRVEQTSVTEETVTTPAVSIHAAALQGDIQAIRQHIEAGSDLDEKEASGGSSPLITAATFGKTDVALALIKAGADVNFTNNDGSTPLHTAAFFCRTEIVEALLANGADKNIRNKAGGTALESVTDPFEKVKGIYDYFGQTFEPLGLELDYDHLIKTRPEIAELLQ